MNSIFFKHGGKRVMRLRPLFLCQNWQHSSNSSANGDGRLANKTCIITGVGSGLGREATKIFVENGATVIGIDIDNKALKETQTLYGCDVYEADVSNENDVKTYMKDIISKYNKIDVLLNNAGIFHPGLTLCDVDMDTFDKIMKVNLYSMYYNCKYLIPKMIELNHGMSIINMASVAGIRGLPGVSAYGISKHGVVGLTRSLACDYGGSNIRANSICPGMVDTPLLEKVGLTQEIKEMITQTLPLKRLLNTGEVMQMALFLASDDSIGCNGQEFVVDHGMSAKC